jgi:hypothetical protein
MRARLPAPRLRAKASQTLEVPCSVSRTSARCGVWPGPLRHSALSCWSNERTASAASVSSSSGEDNSSVRWRTAARLRASASSAGSRSAVRVGCSKTAPARGKTSLIRGAPKEGGGQCPPLLPDCQGEVVTQAYTTFCVQLEPDSYTRRGRLREQDWTTRSRPASLNTEH